MPSEKILASKKQAVEELTEVLKNSCTGVLVDYKGINVADDTKLRKEMREAGVKYSVVKNSLLSFAFDNIDMPEMKEHLNGTTAIATSESDYIAAAKILAAYAEKSDTFNIKAGFIDGKYAPKEDIETLAKLPSREELVAKALGGLNAPISGLVYALNANLTGLVVALNAIAAKKGE